MNIKEIRAREQVATPGPWERDNSHVKRSGSNALVAAVQTFHNPFETAEFIAHARQDIPDLLSEIDRLESRNVELGTLYLQHQQRAIEQKNECDRLTSELQEAQKQRDKYKHWYEVALEAANDLGDEYEH